MAIKKKKTKKVIKKKAVKKVVKKKVVKKPIKKPREKAFPKFEMFKKILFSQPGITPTQAAIDAGYRCKNREIAGQIASQNLRKLKITMRDLMDRMGMTDEKDLLKLKSLQDAKKTTFFQHEGIVTDSRDVDDNTTQLKALELTQKIKGNLTERADDSGQPSYIIFIQEAIRKHKAYKEEKGEE